jgi:apolipoprotein N-acyltransferase
MQSYFFLLVTAVGWPLLFPPVNLGWMAWGGLIPLLWATQGLSPSEAFRRGWLAGWVAHLGLLYWLVGTIQSYGEVSWSFLGFNGGALMGVASWFLLSAYRALFWGVFCGVLNRFPSVPTWLLAPSLWVSLEYIQSIFLTGFPWENFGYSQHQNLYLIQISEVTGVYGVSFILVGVNALLFQILRDWRRFKVFAKQKELLVTLALLIFLHLMGYVRVQKIEGMMANEPKMKLSLIQGNIRQDQKWSPEFREATLDRYFNLSREALQNRPDLLIWPETALPFFFEIDALWREKTVEGIQELGLPLLVGSPSRAREDFKIHYYNSAFLISSEGEVLGRYDKIHLVPFGEYVPLQSLLFFLQPVVPGAGNFSAGDKNQLLVVEKLRGGVLICYEVIFPEEARNRVKMGANVLINITNDAWFGRSSAPYQHLSMAPFRAIENRRALVRVANTGITAFVTPTGRVLQETPLYEEASISDEVPFLNIATFYTRWGDLFARLNMILLLGILLLSLRKRDVSRNRKSD